MQLRSGITIGQEVKETKAKATKPKLAVWTVADQTPESNEFVNTCNAYSNEMDDGKIRVFTGNAQTMYRVMIVHKQMNYVLQQRAFICRHAKIYTSWEKYVQTIANKGKELLVDANNHLSNDAKKWTKLQRAKLEAFASTMNEVIAAFSS